MPATLRAALALAALACFAQSASAACYLVYGPDKEIVYRSYDPPVDMSQQFHETLPRVAPGSVLVFSPDNFGCDVTINKLPLTPTAATGATPGMRPPRADRG